jgi:hypothetical protein
MKNNSPQPSMEKKSQGFVLLFSVVVSAIIFFIGAGMYSIAFKELAVSQLTQDSQKSIFAADSGMECGYLVRNAVFNGVTTVECLGQTTQVIPSFAGQRFFTLGFDNDSCVRVTIDQDTTNARYMIYGQGYNKCVKDGDQWVPVNYIGLTERVYRAPFGF